MLGLENKYKIVFEPVVVKTDLKLIDKKNKDNIRKNIDFKLKTQPDLYSLPLRRPLSNYRKLRVGKYRIIFKLNTKKKICIIIGIRHRENIYKQAEKRI